MTRAIKDGHLTLKDRVLNRWALGWTCADIKTDLALPREEAASVIIQRARKAGDHRAEPRNSSPTFKVMVKLPKKSAVVDELRDEADSRGITVNELAERLLRHAATSKIIGAILDEAA